MRVVALCLALLAVACAHAHNYLDPDAPLYEGTLSSASEPGEAVRVVPQVPARRGHRRALALADRGAVEGAAAAPGAGHTPRPLRGRGARPRRSAAPARLQRPLRHAHRPQFAPAARAAGGRRGGRARQRRARIIGGDFNSKALAERLAGEGFDWPTRDVGRTTALFSFDHILARGLTRSDAPAAGVAREVEGVSDTSRLGPIPPGVLKAAAVTRLL